MVSKAGCRYFADSRYIESAENGIQGLEVHEAPSLNGANDKPMPVGTVCSAEPGIYLPGKFGVRIEDVLIFREDGYEDITHSPKNLIIV